MAHLTEAPCRVSSDLRSHQREQDQRALDVDQFDEDDEQKVRDTVGRARAGPVGGLLKTLRPIELANGIGGLDKARAFDSLIGDLRKLRLGCLERWEQL